MKYILLLLICFTAFIACNKNERSRSAAALESSQFVINTDRDTTIETKNGALLDIPQGTLETDNGSTVTLEVKEAYTIAQMIQARLTTQSDGQPLSSGGMIYINAVAGQKVTIKKKIRVAIPTAAINKDMQLFKGEENADGSINWTDPSPLPPNKEVIAVDSGETLFQSNCASCHAIGKDLAGPNLAHFMRRFPLNKGNEDYYSAHLFDRSEAYPCCETINTTTIKDSVLPDRKFTGHYNGNPYRCNLVRMFGSTGPSYEGAGDASGADDILAIYRYIQEESDRRFLPLPAHAYLKDCVDSCRQYKELASLREQRETALEENGDMVKQKTITNTNPSPAPPVNSTVAPRSYDDKVSPNNYGSLYYQFSIETVGWYNIDMLMKGRDGVEESELFVRIRGEYREKINVYLAIPFYKILLEGGSTDKNADEYAFDTKDGKISLPQNIKAYILAITETKTSVAYSIREFMVSRQQSIDVSLASATKEQFNAAIQQFSTEGINITVAEAKNAGLVQELDEKIKQAESMKPKRCDCECRSIIDSVIIVK